MTEFILTPKTRHMSASTILDMIHMRKDMQTAKFLQDRYPDCTLLEKIAHNVGVKLIGTGYNKMPIVDNIESV